MSILFQRILWKYPRRKKTDVSAVKLGIHKYQKDVSSFSIHIIMEAFAVLLV